MLLLPLFPLLDGAPSAAALSCGVAAELINVSCFLEVIRSLLLVFSLIPLRGGGGFEVLCPSLSLSLSFFLLFSSSSSSVLVSSRPGICPSCRLKGSNEVSNFLLYFLLVVGFISGSLSCCPLLTSVCIPRATCSRFSFCLVWSCGFALEFTCSS